MFARQSTPDVSIFLRKYTNNLTSNHRINDHVLDLICTLMKYNSYHSPHHVLSMLNYADSQNINLSDAQKIAILFHDIIYIPFEKDNEERSSQFMNCILRGYISKPILNEASEIILATSRHLQKNELCQSAFVVMDLDLATLAHPDYNEFLYIGDLIYREFVNFGNIKHQEFLNGRIQFFKELLSKGFIFRSEEFAKFEQLAQSNIERYIKENEK